MSGGRTELAQASGTDIEVVPNLTGEFDRVLRPYRFSAVLTEKIFPIYVGTHPTEHTLVVTVLVAIL